MSHIKKLTQILVFNSGYIKYDSFALLLIIEMPENSEDCKIENHITSSDNQFLAQVQSEVGVSDKVRQRTSPLVEKNPQLEIDDYAKLTKVRYFMVCESCLWCASYIKNQTTFTKCPLCHNGKIDCMPIGEDENYLFDYSHSKGVELKFANNIRC
jgi:hypothetical protein